MQKSSFIGGIHPLYSKECTKGVHLSKSEDPKIVIIPMQQHIGAPCEPLVQVGDKVKIGQKIGDSKAFVSVPVHASIAGTVKLITTLDTPSGRVLSVIIESDGSNEVHENVVPKGNLDQLTSEDIKSIIREAGIVGMGGAGFPTHVKLSPPKDKKIDTVILNGVECEPYLSADHRLMVEYPERVIYGLKAIMKVLDVNKGYIGIEDNKPDAIDSISKALGNDPDISVAALKTKYPQGDEKRLIHVISGRKVPSGGLPMDVGVVVNNVGTASAIARAILEGMPLIERITTIAGNSVANPQNLIARIGTPIKDLIEQCGGYKGNPGKLIMGGPMMGFAQFSDEIPIIKSSSGILVFPQSEVIRYNPQPCIKCARCVDVCPVGLLPIKLANFSEHSMWNELIEYSVLACIECGSCSFICPAKRPLLERIRLAKGEIITRRKNS